ncbi:hypothetical protein F511_25584 [Dorcoceras hygrometricum]|uniref:Uncharacterized protein n=1 Tax=Dorcoceras hygrometricum TaxID=472368 RepID=A0A2Z7ASG8_9LAMI|nr:hypothetical protein F511_25584 [Dorcoceras hygrometricum]
MILRIDQDEARLAAQGCTWYEINASTLRESDISYIKDKAGITSLYEVVIPHVHARAHRPPAGFHTFYINQIDRGLRFPIPTFISSLCDHIGISPSQLTPNSFSSILSLAILLKFFGKSYARMCQCGTGLRVPSWSGLRTHVEELREDVPVRNWASSAELVGLTYSRRRATRGCASAELGFECRAGRAYKNYARMCQCGTGLRMPSWSGLRTHVEELREDVPVRNWASNAKLVGLTYSCRRTTRGCASAELGFECQAGRAYKNYARMCQCGTGLRMPSWSGLRTHVEELREDVPVRNWASNAKLVGLTYSCRRTTRGCASAELGFECQAGRAYVLIIGLRVPSWSGLRTHVEELHEDVPVQNWASSAELVGLTYSRRRATRGCASAELGFECRAGRAYVLK